MSLRPLSIGLVLFLAACAPAASQTIPAPATETGSEQSTSIAAKPAVPSGTIAVTERLLSGGILEIGSATAPTNIMIFMNHASAYSQQFNQSLIPLLITDFVSHGSLRIDIVPLVLKKYPQSADSAAIFLCGAKQGKGRDINDLLFGNTKNEDIPKRVAAIGLDLKTLQDCMKSPEVQKMFDAEQQFANMYKITLIPSYILNNRIFTGLPEYSDLKGQVQDAINAAH